MEFSPTEATVYGGEKLFIDIPENSPLHPQGEMFVMYQGQSQRHLASTITYQHSLETIIPAHKIAEPVYISVIVLLDRTSQTIPLGNLTFTFGPVYHLARHLMEATFLPHTIEDVDRLYTRHFDLSDLRRDIRALDEGLVKAFTHMEIPEHWHILGHDSNCEDPPPRETILHFAARLGLEQVTRFLMRHQGTYDGLGLPNREGLLPVDIARDNGYTGIVSILLGTSSFDPGGGGPPWLDRKRLHQHSDVHKYNSGVVSVTTNLSSDNSRTLADDIALIQDMTSVMQRPEVPRRNPALTNKVRSKSDGVLKDERRSLEDTDEDHGDGSQGYQGPGGAHRYKRRRPSQRSQHARHHYLRKRESGRSQSTGSAPVEHTSALDSPPYVPNEPSYQDPPQRYKGVLPLQPSYPSHTSILYKDSGYSQGAAHRRSRDYEDKPTVLEENIRRIHDISEGIYKLRDPKRQSAETPNTARKETLQRHSTSCPSLNDKVLKPVFDDVTASTELDSYKSMVDLAVDGSKGGRDSPHDTERSAMYNGHNVQIVISEATVDDSNDLGCGGGDPELMAICDMKKNQRRSSWCPEEGRKLEDKQERRAMLSVTGRSQSLSSLDSDDNGDESDDDSDDSSHPTMPTFPEPDLDLEDPIVNQSEAVTSRSPLNQTVNSSTSSLGLTNTFSTPPRAKSTSNLDTSAQSVKSAHSFTDIRFNEGGEVADSSACDMAPLNLHSPPPPAQGHQAAVIEASSATLSVPLSSGNLIKSSSTPSINSTDSEKSERKRARSGSTSDTSDAGLDTQSPSGLDGEDGGLHINKEEKKRRSSLFSKIGSYRQRKSIKETRDKSTHQFVTVSFSNSTSCDVCAKTMSNKPALQCENCMVNVHESVCMEQIAVCSRSRGGTKLGRFQSSSLPEGHGSSTHQGTTNLKSSQSFKETKRANSAPASRQLQVSQSTSQLGKVSTFTQSKVISEEKVHEDEPIVQPGDAAHFDDITASNESLDEVDSVEVEEEPLDLSFKFNNNEPEAWNVTVDKKTLKKMSAKDIKRQDHIWELILTEKNHLQTLTIMHKIFAEGMRRECGMSQNDIDRMFPKLSELIEIHSTFVHKLTERQRLRSDKSIENIGDVMVKQFGGKMGQQMKEVYGVFCSKHTEAVALYKDKLKTDRPFQAFINKCSRHAWYKRRGIPECILLVTQRLTKYPLLIESIFNATRENKEDRDDLTMVLSLSKSILSHVNHEVDLYENNKLLMGIYHNLDARSSVIYKNKKFKKSDLLMNNRRLIYKCVVKWINARGKAFEVLLVILTDLMFFLQDNNGKYTFFSQDNKSSVVSLNHLLVREKGDTRDSKGVYIIRQCKTEPEMYEVVCRSGDERKKLVKIIWDACKRCPIEENITPSEVEEERRRLEARAQEVQHLINVLRQKDGAIENAFKEKNKVVLDLLDIYGREDNTQIQNPDNMDIDDLIQASIHEATRMAGLIQNVPGGPHASLTNVGRSTSCVGTYERGQYNTPPVPKRAETFSGFEGKIIDKDDLKKRQCDHEETDSISQVTETVGLSPESANKERMNRRMSTSFLQNLLTKQHNDKVDTDGSSHKSDNSDSGSVCDLSTPSPPGGLYSVPPTKEQCACMAQLLHYIHGLAAMTSQQKSEVEVYKTQLSEAKSKLARYALDSDKFFPDKKHPFHHDKQLEELRNLQEQIRLERVELDRVKDKKLSEVNSLRNQIQDQELEIDKQKNELKAQKEELQRQKLTLQKQMDLFEAQKSEFHQMEVSFRKERELFEEERLHFRRNLNNAGSNSSSPRGSISSRERSESPVAATQKLLIEKSHKRSASDDFNKGARQGSPFEPLKTEHTNSLQEPLNQKKDGTSKMRSHSSSTSVSSVLSPGGGSRKESTSEKPLPIHLLSATNEARVGPIPQQLPLKLSNFAASGKSGVQSSKPLPPNVQGVPHKLPAKLLSLSSSSSPTGVATTRSVSSVSSSNIGVTSQNSRAIQGASLSHAKSQPTLHQHRQVQQPQHSAPSVLPMKLAEKQRPKSASAASRQNNISQSTTSGSRNSQTGSKQSDEADTMQEEIYC